MESSSPVLSSDQNDKSQEKIFSPVTGEIGCLICGRFSDVETYHDISSSYSSSLMKPSYEIKDQFAIPDYDYDQRDDICNKKNKKKPSI